MNAEHADETAILQRGAPSSLSDVKVWLAARKAYEDKRTRLSSLRYRWLEEHAEAEDMTNRVRKALLQRLSDAEFPGADI
jgi:hypothetical protein